MMEMEGNLKSDMVTVNYKEIFKNKKGYTVCAALVMEKSSRRISTDIFIKTPSGEMSDLVSVRRSKLVNSKNVLDFLLDMEGFFTREEIDKVHDELKKLMEKDKPVNIQDRATMEEMYLSLCRYIKDNEEKLDDNKNAEVFIRDGKGYIRTDALKQFVSEYSYLGMKKIDILRRLKVMGKLDNSPSRTYDAYIRVGEKANYFYRVILEEICASQEKEDEVIQL